MTGHGTDRLDRLFARFTSRNPDASAVLAVESLDGSFAWSSGHGSRSTRAQEPFSADDPYFLASATKLYVVALVMQLRAEGSLELDTPVVDLLPAGAIAGVHVLHGRDHTAMITVRHLLTHTSGLADYLEDRQSDRTVLLDIVSAPGGDRGWTRDDVLEINRHRTTPRFAPGSRRAHYSDTNFQILGLLIETITGRTFEANLRDRICVPLGLTGTHVFGTESSPVYDDVATMLRGKAALRIPLVMASVTADGGIVSSAADSITFLRAFFTGRLFPNHYLAEMQQQWRRVFFPLEYGVGLMRFELPRLMSPFARPPVLLGHSGVNGTLMFFEPNHTLLVAGTVNQLRPRSLGYRLMLGAVQAAPR